MLWKFQHYSSLEKIEILAVDNQRRTILLTNYANTSVYEQLTLKLTDESHTVLVTDISETVSISNILTLYYISGSIKSSRCLFIDRTNNNAIIESSPIITSRIE